jgi:hypothetical protein
MTAIRREDVTAHELPTPTPAVPKVWPRVVAAAVLLLAGGAFGVWLLLRPQPCDGKFSSDRFSYCVAVPDGWSSQPATIGSVPVDEFVRSGEDATVVVIAFNLRPGTDLTAYATAARDRDRQAGLLPGAITPARLGDSPALKWELLAAGENTASFRAIEVVSVHDSVGWTLQLDGTIPSFTRHIGALNTMLGSWTFR